MTAPNIDRYLVANHAHVRAEREFLKAQRRFRKLVGRMDPERAYDLAGVGLADRRMVDAFGAMRAAHERFQSTMRNCATLERIAAAGAILCSNVEPRGAANDCGEEIANKALRPRMDMRHL